MDKLHQDDNSSKKKYRRRWIILILLLSSLFLCRACGLRPAYDYRGDHFNKGTNAAWLGIEWVNEPADAEAIATLVKDLKTHQIKYVFVYVSYYKDGDFNQSYAYATSFLEQLHTENIQVLAWIGLPLGDEDKNLVALSNPKTRNTISQFCMEMMALGFDGVHLDPEPIQNDDKYVLRLLEEVRLVIGEGIISIATPRIWPVFPEFSWPDSVPVWNGDYYREVALRVDQIAVMVYDSAMPISPFYWQWSRFQTINVSKALQSYDGEVFLGIPTSEENSLTHRPWAETMESGLKGTIAGLNDKAAYPEVITGVAIYPYWETDDEEWQIYQRLWLGQK